MSHLHFPASWCHMSAPPSRFLDDMPSLSQSWRQFWMCAQQPLGTFHIFHLLLEPIFLNLSFLPEDGNNLYPLRHELGRLTEKIKIDPEPDCESRAASCLPILQPPRPHTQTNLVEHNSNYFTTCVVTYSGMWITYKDLVAMWWKPSSVPDAQINMPPGDWQSAFLHLQSWY